ncbi:MAG: hypothetical protein R3F60_23360 [bacterium]
MVARTGTGEAPLVLLDRELDLACGERRAVVVEVPVERWLPPTTRAYTSTTSARRRIPAVHLWRGQGPGDLRGELRRRRQPARAPGCFRPDNAARQFQRLEVTFAAEAVARSYSLHRLRRTFALYLAVPSPTSRSRRPARASPQVGAPARLRPDHPGAPPSRSTPCPGARSPGRSRPRSWMASRSSRPARPRRCPWPSPAAT